LPPVSAFANCFAAEPPSRSLFDELERLRARPPDRFDVAAAERLELPRAAERADPFEPPALRPLAPRFVSAIYASLQASCVPQCCATGVLPN
jgi:hypothetical protein